MIMKAAQALNAIEARQAGVFDHPDLVTWGPLSTNTHADVLAIKQQCLHDYGFVIGLRDPRVNRNYAGRYMVVEAHNPCELPTDDGSNGPWCVVGNDLTALIGIGFDFLVGCDVDGK